ncbi:MAG TPA: extracellular solute-binding protein [Acetobacteraceae bacterium]|nr:extracellular solute-binding protein [Acetobacteraceae bacterium]
MRLRAIMAGLALAMGIGIARPQPRQGLVLYSALGCGPAVAAAFTRKTGIPVRVASFRTGALFGHIAAEGRHPRWSLAWFNDAPGATALDQRGLLAHGLPEPSGLTKRGKAMLGPDAAYVPTGFTLAGVFVTAADPYLQPPPDWPALTGPRYRGIVGLSDPLLSQGDYPLLAGMLESGGGWPGGKPFIRALKHAGLHIYADDSDVLAALRSGSISVGVMPLSTALHAASLDKALRVTIPRPAYAAPSVIVMAKGLPAARRRKAERFIAFVNRPSVQRLRMRSDGDGPYWPVTASPPPPAILPPASGAAVLNAAKWGARERAVIGWFSRRIVGRSL